MATTWERLQTAFIEDHRSVARGYRELVDLLEINDFLGASHAASRLDTVAGPHIEFEEKYLYPHVAKSRGDAHMSRMFHEHDEILSVLKEVQHASSGAPPADEIVQQWVAQLRVALDHASACGTMIGELEMLPVSEQLKFLDGLTRLRDLGSRWSELECHEQGKN